MYDAILFLQDGFEEIEVVATLDILRRAGVKVASVSFSGKRQVTGKHAITILADMIIDDLKDISEAMLILPGGPAVIALKNNEYLKEMLKLHDKDGGKIAAICAAPTILGGLGLLNSKEAVCYPGMENELNALKISESSTITDGNITTSRSPGSTFEFALELVKIIKGKTEAAKVAEFLVL